MRALIQKIVLIGAFCLLAHQATRAFPVTDVDIQRGLPRDDSSLLSRAVAPGGGHIGTGGGGGHGDEGGGGGAGSGEHGSGSGGGVGEGGAGSGTSGGSMSGQNQGGLLQGVDNQQQSGGLLAGVDNKQQNGGSTQGEQGQSKGGSGEGQQSGAGTQQQQQPAPEKPPRTFEPSDGPDPAVPEVPINACKAAKRTLAARCEPWDPAHNGIVDDAQNRPGVRNNEDLLKSFTKYKDDGKLSTREKAPDHLKDVQTKYQKGYRTDPPDNNDNSLSTGHSQQSQIRGLLATLNDPSSIDIDGATYADFKTFSKLRNPPTGKDANQYASEYTARNKVGTGSDHVILLSEENYAKKDTNRYANPTDNDETKDAIYNEQALKNNDLAFMHMYDKLGGDIKGLGKKFIYYVQEGIDNPNTVSYTLFHVTYLQFNRTC